MTEYYETEDLLYGELSAVASNKTLSFIDELRRYILDEYNTNLTSYIKVIDFNLDVETIEYWDNLVTEDTDPQEYVDNVFIEYDLRKKKKFQLQILGGDSSQAIV
jgi:hypothetical protein